LATRMGQWEWKGRLLGPTARRYPPEEKARSVWLVRQLRKERGTTYGSGPNRGSSPQPGQDRDAGQLRELTIMLIDPFGSGAGAPAWVHVEDRATKELKWRVAAGRQLGAGEQILGSMQEDLEGMTPNEFEGQWRR